MADSLIIADGLLPPRLTGDSLVHACLTDSELPGQRSRALTRNIAIPAFPDDLPAQLRCMVRTAPYPVTLMVHGNGAGKPAPPGACDRLAQGSLAYPKFRGEHHLSLACCVPASDLLNRAFRQPRLAAIPAPVRRAVTDAVLAHVLLRSAPGQVNEPVIKRTAGAMQRKESGRPDAGKCFQYKVRHQARRAFSVLVQHDRPARGDLSRAAWPEHTVPAPPAASYRSHASLIADVIQPFIPGHRTPRLLLAHAWILFNKERSGNDF